MYRYLLFIQIGNCNENFPVKQEHEADFNVLIYFVRTLQLLSSTEAWAKSKE